ncbi:nitrogenase molybdenum-iron cofactor biosynthesis protein [Methanocella sp. CWC-04]|uniref:FeMo cofactor biosynthesis protein NifB n=1 Tax=Methanooceanicella nereidis TaxID=2052831 RepID=A0AAP2RC24_9EURY|nr:radical SAM protein [Methanocella sp. CWC-04]MCD1294769.1 nitrogenase molybdenum-iron cofactor biosynthesis protein [Methanocella sp. CWC-04]
MEELKVYQGPKSKFSHMTSAHPCFNEKAHFSTARIHLPVAPKCNIQCNFCTRKIDKCEHRPGVSSGVMTPQEAADRVDQAVKEVENLRVVGVAGPGEALANEETIETFKLVHQRHPNLIKCVATNGLYLAEKVDDLVKVGINSVTVTINAIDPAVGAKIYSWIRYHNKTYRGEEGAKLLIENQIKGVEAAVKAGFIVKVNTVLIPEINAEQIEPIAKMAAEKGAILMNIIPMIPLYKFAGMKAPECSDLEKARATAEKYLPQFRLCKQCRADACGVPGKEESISPAQRVARGEYYHA